MLRIRGGAGVFSVALSLSLWFVGAMVVVPTACAEDGAASGSASAEPENAESKSIVLTAMEAELQRSMRKLKNAAAAPL
ncbi:MAG: hypothetical protein JNN26_23230, partial [Candidatus Obscuribacter sp.]|nr:hypothetical protein [Candidatus Obscuribacter sp.]